jgi:hypothetical protein
MPEPMEIEVSGLAAAGSCGGLRRDDRPLARLSRRHFPCAHSKGMIAANGVIAKLRPRFLKHARRRGLNVSLLSSHTVVSTGNELGGKRWENVGFIFSDQ